MPADRSGALRVLWTRPAGRGARSLDRLREAGFDVDHRPTIAFEPPADPRPAARAAERAADYDWVVFTSPTGVEFFDRAGGGGLRPAPRRAAVVGQATRRAVEGLGVAAEVVADPPRADGLAAALRPRVRPGDRVLVVRPESAPNTLSSALEDAGAIVEAVAFYRTVAAPGVSEIAADLRDGRYDAVVFSSPSTFQSVLDAATGGLALVSALRTVAVVAIGGVTAHALGRAGLEPSAVASDPSDEALVVAVRSCFR